MSTFEQEDILHLVFADEPESDTVEPGTGTTAELNARVEWIGLESLNPSACLRDTILESVQAQVLAQASAS